MGNCLRFLINKLTRQSNSKKNIVLMMAGLDNAGKTSVLNMINNEPDPTVMPTMGFRVLSLKHKLFNVKVYDIGGAAQIRAIWKKYYHDIHGLIYVVDASDISRLTENKIVFGELIANEHIAGKPVLLLANKQDVPGAMDELDIVENLSVEYAANSMRSPTRVETCACQFNEEDRNICTLGIYNGYKWLLDTIAKNYTTLDNRIKNAQTPVPVKKRRRPSMVSMTPSRASIRSNPFKPIGQLVANAQTSMEKQRNNHIEKPTGRLKKFLAKNKTGPMPLHIISKSEDALNTLELGNVEPFNPNEDSEEASFVTLDPLNLLNQHMNRSKRSRPLTAPAATNGYNFRAQNIPGQVPQ